ncbi:MAG: IPExxxVDY family protein [Flammeovirgaceae bacterium]|nr:MAG: IPExxxVDY family protein [Flammeovirgaceae bacterium]
MKKNKLVIEYAYNFKLTGIASTAKGYKLAWAINRQTGFRLVRQPDLAVGFKKEGEKYFNFFAYETRLNRLKLFKNKPVDQTAARHLLVPEFPHFDFILLTQAEEPGFTAMVVEKVRNLPMVELVAPIPLESLKSKVNFIF